MSIPALHHDKGEITVNAICSGPAHGGNSNHLEIPACRFSPGRRWRERVDHSVLDLPNDTDMIVSGISSMVAGTEFRVSPGDGQQDFSHISSPIVEK